MTTPDPFAVAAATRMIRVWAAQTIDDARGLASGSGGSGPEASTPQDDYLTITLWLQSRQEEGRGLSLARLVLSRSTVLYSTLACLRPRSKLSDLLADLEGWAYCQAKEQVKANLPRP